MPLDGIAVSAVVSELSARVAGGRIGKIYQPERDEINITVRNNGQNHRILLSAEATCPRVHLTGASRENPSSAPVFCMLLRKHLSNGRIISVIQPRFDRVIEIRVEAMDEMGDLGEKTLIAEIMGKHSNIILTDSNGTVLDSIKRVSSDISSLREVLPGRLYTPPPTGNLDTLELSRGQFLEILRSGGAAKLTNVIYKHYNGISPVMAAEIVYRSGVEPETAQALSEADMARVYNAFYGLMDDVRRGAYRFTVYISPSGRPDDFFCLPVSVAEGKQVAFDSVSDMLDSFYMERDKSVRMGQKSQNMRRLISTHLERCYKKKDMYAQNLKDIADRDTYKLYGELLTANIYAIRQGMTRFDAVNYTSAAGETVTIPIDPAKTPAENAQKYFKRYGKEKRSFEAVKAQIAQNDEDIAYLESVMSFLQNAASEVELSAIQTELSQQGYMKRHAPKGQKRPLSPKMTFGRYVSSDGFEILVGKNNIQNDELTVRVAHNADIWLHVKGEAGSHVIIRTGGKDVVVPDKTVEEAAQIAAFFSKARCSLNAAVDYCVRKNVKKPAGARPGMVVYERYKTAYVTPNELFIKTLEKLL